MAYAVGPRSLPTRPGPGGLRRWAALARRNAPEEVETLWRLPIAAVRVGWPRLAAQAARHDALRAELRRRRGGHGR
jgi:hypothetical protein